MFHYRAFALKSKVGAGVSSFNSYEWYDQVLLDKIRVPIFFSPYKPRKLTDENDSLSTHF